ALPARFVRALRSLRRQTLRPRDPTGALQGAQHRADPRAHHRARPRAVPERAGDREDPVDARRRRPGLLAIGPAGDDALRWRGATREAGERALAPGDG